MLGIIITYASFHEFLPFQLKNIAKYVKQPYTVFVVNNSQKQFPVFETANNVVIIPFPFITANPSHNHQMGINMGLRVAWEHCSCFLLFDNDMIFLSEWKEPKEQLYYELQTTSGVQHCWMNIMYLKKFQSTPFEFKFYQNPDTKEWSDSGGSTTLWLKDSSLDKKQLRYISIGPERDLYFQEYQCYYEALCDEYKLHRWCDLYDFNGTLIFHYRAMSNYCRLPESFMQKKKQLILETVQFA